MIQIKGKLTKNDLLFPSLKPWKVDYIDVGDDHSLYVQQFGKPDGIPVLIVHGGPGLGLYQGSGGLRLHDPSYFRIVAVDQRGCGASKPHVADDREKAFFQNNPKKLAHDFEVIRKNLGIDRWHVSGYSWGSCLSIYYASMFPRSILSLTIGAVWMHTPEEIDWFINRMGLFFPEAEAELFKILPKNTNHTNRLERLYRAIIGKDRNYAHKVATAHGSFEEVACYFESPQELKENGANRKSASEKLRSERDMTAVGAIEIFFMKEHPLPSQWYKTSKVKTALKQIKDIVIIQGRFDIVCPPAMAFDLHLAHPHSECNFIHYAGHARTYDFCHACIKANERLKIF